VNDDFLGSLPGADGVEDPDGPPGREGDSLRESRTPPDTAVVDNSGGAYPTEEWAVDYYSTDRTGALHEHHVSVRVPYRLGGACAPVNPGRPGCIYTVRRWGFMLRPSALDRAGFDPALLAGGNDAEVLRAILHASAFELPGEFILASPEHPFRLLAGDGQLRGSFVEWRTYLGALSYFVSGGRVRASFLRLWAEAEDSYRQAVDICLQALATKSR
jgi:hypothetical protein